MKQEQVRCKRCGVEIDSANYPKHLEEAHRDFSKSKYVEMPTATICVRCKKNKITNFVNGTCIECSKLFQV